jgi:ribosomal protein L31E
MQEEKILTFSLKEWKDKSRVKRANYFIRRLREKVRRITKVDDISISKEVNEEIWKRSVKKSLKKIRIKISKDENKVKVELVK